MEVTKFTEDHNMGCTYGFDLVRGIHMKIWVVDESLPKYTKIEGYQNMDHYLVFNKKSTDKLTPKQMQSALDQYGFEQIGEINMDMIEKHYKLVLETQERGKREWEGSRL